MLLDVNHVSPFCLLGMWQQIMNIQATWMNIQATLQRWKEKLQPV